MFCNAWWMSVGGRFYLISFFKPIWLEFTPLCFCAWRKRAQEVRSWRPGVCCISCNFFSTCFPTFWYPTSSHLYAQGRFSKAIIMPTLRKLKTTIHLKTMTSFCSTVYYWYLFADFFANFCTRRGVLYHYSRDPWLLPSDPIAPLFGLLHAFWSFCSLHSTTRNDSFREEADVCGGKKPVVKAQYGNLRHNNLVIVWERWWRRQLFGKDLQIPI